MPRAKRDHLRYKKERLVLSDVLPFEIPLIFSNRHFYNFLVSQQLAIVKDRVYWRGTDDATGAIVKLIFGGLYARQVNREVRTRSGRPIDFSNLRIDVRDDFDTTPFTFKVKHKEDSYRDLSLCHPRNQIALIEFFDKHKEAILYYCSLSPFSIRKPVRVARYRYFKDKFHREALNQGESAVEEYDKEYESLRSFFVYKEHDNVNKFYDSEKFLHCEKKFGKLVKLDIARCFDSIYTHSVCWALVGKEVVKTHRRALADHFADDFDRLMRSMNRSETNGILIGPEFSRIFAELILQSVDRKVCSQLEAEQFFHRTDYEVFRYVDDYFIFYQDDQIRDRVIQALRLELREYKLHLNDAKRVDFVRPILTNLTRAKHRVSDLLEEALHYELERVYDSKSQTPTFKGTFRITPTELQTSYKTVVSECGVEESTLLSWTLSIVERYCRRAFKKHLHVTNRAVEERRFTASIANVLGFIFFAYSAAPRVNTTIRLCRILHIIADYFRNSEDRECRDLVFQQIYDDIQLILKRQANAEHVQVETLYLLHTLSELGEPFVLDDRTLARFFGIKMDGSKYVAERKLNYFSIIVLLFYVKKAPRHRRLREFVESYVVEKTRERHARFDDTESILLVLDLLVCPYVGIETKRELLRQFDINDPALQDSVIARRKLWFTKWVDFRFQTELDYKLGQEVY